MAFALGQAARAAGYRLAAHDAIVSTNAEALALARAGEEGRLWIVTGHQTGGRGRRGRSWQGPKGNLAASLLIRSRLEPFRLATLGFVAGLTVVDALDSLAPNGEEARIALKWPNDLLADGRKFVGILLESENLADGTTALVVGIGINVAATPSGMPYLATSLADIGWTTSAEVLFAALSDTWIGRHAQWDEGRGMPLIRDDWMKRAAGVGSQVTVTTGAREISGLFESLDEDGCLVVLQSGGTRIRVSSGDVHFGDAASLPAAG